MRERVPYGEGRDLLIAATIAVVAEKGLRGLTFRAVADVAGVNNSLVAHHFGSRDALLLTAMESAVERSIDSSGLTDIASDEDFAATLLASVTTEPELQAFQYEMILEARRNPPFREPVRRLYDRYQREVAEGLVRLGFAGDVEGAARRIFAALDGLVLQTMAGLDRPELRRAIDDVVRAARAEAAALPRRQGEATT
ncbi:TetR family transcriptional regulator [Microbacterium sp. NPDC077184]|uniref:TetR/AcrR family transcriptional regulator n=1 Tax=Microbacterium sp. NPDC077184 TaxID=3154764 RepID=UPI00343AC843